MRWSRSVVSVVACVALLVGCDETPAPSATAPSESTGTADCSHWIGMTAAAVAEELREFSISWRLERTDPETGPVSEVVADPPEGSVTNVAVADGEIIVFVSPVDDPLQEFAASSLSCPEP